MNSMAQQAVPNGKGQNELLVAQSSSASNLVVTQLSPTVFIGVPSLSGRVSLSSFVTFVTSSVSSFGRNGLGEWHPPPLALLSAHQERGIDRQQSGTAHPQRSIAHRRRGIDRLREALPRVREALPTVRQALTADNELRPA